MLGQRFRGLGALLLLLPAMGCDAGVCGYCRYAKFCDSECPKCPCTHLPNCDMCGYCKFCRLANSFCGSCDGGALATLDGYASWAAAGVAETLGYADVANALREVESDGRLKRRLNEL